MFSSEREDMLPFFKAKIQSIAAAHGERLLNTDGNGCVALRLTLPYRALA
jgi:hypothetical protein